ncbi:MAG TPA: carbohydrate-binding family 9-like protein [Pyrinomonadaceae bacterium]|nr:carbohydrate-binding family 9-like protein [Pyrinomonadaceae bacterium]
MSDEKQIIEAHHIATDLPVADLKSALWNQAQPVKIDRYWSGEAAPAARHCEARILWSSKALHLRFVGRQAEPLVVSATPQTAAKTMGLWDRDVCEIFIAPDSNVVERYFEFEAAPNGEWLDVAIHWTPEKRESDWEFQSHMTTASQVERDRITIGMRIPWNHWIHEPQRDERWRVNLFRCIGTDPGRGYLTWQPTRTKEANFHVPQVFGWLVFK